MKKIACLIALIAISFGSRDTLAQTTQTQPRGKNETQLLSSIIFNYVMKHGTQSIGGNLTSYQIQIYVPLSVYTVSVIKSNADGAMIFRIEDIEVASSDAPSATDDLNSVIRQINSGQRKIISITMVSDVIVDGMTPSDQILSLEHIVKRTNGERDPFTMEEYIESRQNKKTTICREEIFNFSYGNNSEVKLYIDGEELPELTSQDSAYLLMLGETIYSGILTRIIPFLG